MKIEGDPSSGGKLFDAVALDGKPALEPFSKHKFEELAKEFFSIKAQKGATSKLTVDLNGKTIRREVTFNTGVSIGKIIGFIEGIPFLGTPVALLGFMGHLLGMGIDKHKESSLRKAYNEIESGPEKDKEDALSDKNVVQEALFNAKLSYAQNARQMRASALSIILLVKPLTRLVELGIAYFKKPEYDVEKE